MSTKSQIEQAMGLYDVPKAVTELDKIARHSAALLGHASLDEMQRRISDTERIRSGISGVSNSLAMQIEAAQSLFREMERAQTASREIGDIIAFQREFSSIVELQRHIEKALAFQQEIDKARTLQDLPSGLDKAELERKRLAFLNFRDENYIASLRLEGFDVDAGAAPATLEALRSKYARR